MIEKTRIIIGLTHTMENVSNSDGKRVHDSETLIVSIWLTRLMITHVYTEFVVFNGLLCSKGITFNILFIVYA